LKKKHVHTDLIVVSTKEYELKHNIYNTYHGPRNMRCYNSMIIYKFYYRVSCRSLSKF